MQTKADSMGFKKTLKPSAPWYYILSTIDHRFPGEKPTWRKNSRFTCLRQLIFSTR